MGFEKGRDDGEGLTHRTYKKNTKYDAGNLSSDFGTSMTKWWD